MVRLQEAAKLEGDKMGAERVVWEYDEIPLTASERVQAIIHSLQARRAVGMR
jgi:hypothetical protein